MKKLLTILLTIAVTVPAVRATDYFPVQYDDNTHQVADPANFWTVNSPFVSLDASQVVSGVLTTNRENQDGGARTNLNASALATGTVPSSRLALGVGDIPSLPASKIASGVLSTNVENQDGGARTNLNASALSSGTVPSSRLALGTSDIPSLPASKITSGTLSASLMPAQTGDVTTSAGSTATTVVNVSASAITGTIADGRLSANIAKLDTPQSWSGAQVLSNKGNTISGNVAGATNLIRAIGFPINSGGATIATGWHGYQVSLDSFAITNAVIIAHGTGSINIDIYKCTSAQFDDASTHPVVGDKITASAPITITSGVKNLSVDVSSWSTSVSPGDVLECYVNSCSGITWAEIILQGRSR